MIVYACLLRIEDGIPLSATSNFDKGAEYSIQEGKKNVKLLVKHLKVLPSKLCVQGDQITMHCMKDENTCYIIVCDPNYPHILAYSFLDELKKEFSLLYTSSLINTVKRPYGFIEFDSYLQKVQQKYSNPQTLASRLDLSDMTNDLNLNPPVYKKLSDFEIPQIKPNHRQTPLSSSITIPNGSLSNETLREYPHDGALWQMKPIPWYGRIALILSLPCMLLDGYRGIVNLNSSTVEEDAAPSTLHGISFLTEILLLAIQVYLLRKYARRRRLITLLCCSLIVLVNFIVYDIREMIVVITYVCTSFSLVLATFRRTFEKCLPRLNI